MSIDETIENLKKYLLQKDQKKPLINYSIQFLSDNYENLLKSSIFFKLPLKAILNINYYVTSNNYHEIIAYKPNSNIFDIFPNCSVSTLDFLINTRKFKVDMKDKNGYPLLWIALLSKRNDLYEYLVSQGAKMGSFVPVFKPCFQKTRNYENYLIEAIEKDDFLTFMNILKNYSPKIKDVTNDYLMKIALEKSCFPFPFIQYLIERHNSQYYYSYENGESSLHIATEKGYFQILQYLLKDEIEKEKNNVIKIIVFGKIITPLINSLIYSNPIGDYDPNIEDFYPYEMQIDGNSVKLNIYDSTGQDDFAALRTSYMRQGRCFVLVYSIDDKKSFQEISELYKEIFGTKGATQNVPIVICGNNCDREDQRVVSKAEGESLASKLKCHFFETSPITNYQIHDAFESVVRDVLKEDGLFQEFEIPVDNEDNTPLHIAAKNGYLQIVQLFIEKLFVDKNIKGYQDKTPLHYAAENGHLDVVKYLIDEGADKNSSDKIGKTPLNLALEYKKLNVVNYLQSIE